jgi:hypothetical protein
MSSTTISTVNKYLLSSTGPYVPPGPNNNPIETNQVFPYDYSGEISTKFNPNLASTIQTATLNTYSTIKNGNYTIRASSYTTLSGTAMNPSRVFTTIGAGYATSFYFCRKTSGTTWTGFYNDNNQFVSYAQEPYNQLTYLGGGTGNFWTTIYDTNQSINGEWLEIKFPFKALIKSMSIRPISGNYGFFPRTGKLLGSDDGITWVLIGDYNQASPTTYIFFTVTFPTNTKRFQYIRFAISGCTHYVPAFQNLQYGFDIYDLTADTE